MLAPVAAAQAPTNPPADERFKADILVIANPLNPRNAGSNWSLPTPSAFTPEEIALISASGTRVTLPEGWAPISESTGADKAYVILNGTVSVRSHGREARSPIHIRRRGIAQPPAEVHPRAARRQRAPFHPESGARMTTSLHGLPSR